MKQSAQLFCIRIDSSDVGPFVPIAKAARKREVFQRIIGYMLPCNDVIDGELEARESLWHSAVFADAFGAGTNFVLDRFLHQHSRGGVVLTERRTRLGLQNRQQ
jgi:hypothetical protein